MLVRSALLNAWLCLLHRQLARQQCLTRYRPCLCTLRTGTSYGAQECKHHGEVGVSLLDQRQGRKRTMARLEILF